MPQIPYVADGLLSGSGSAGLTVGSPAWFAWLAEDAARSLSFRSPAGAYTARKERRQRGGAYYPNGHVIGADVRDPGWLDAVPSDRPAGTPAAPSRSPD